MRAGALALATHCKKDGVDPEYMESMLRTQQRAAFLKSLAREGKIAIETMIRPHHDREKLTGHTSLVVYVGKTMFTDEPAFFTGAWPSESLVAQVALALAAGEGEK